ncbi:MAG: hypothetical protein AB7S36_17045 [Planctomycetota bacterium]
MSPASARADETLATLKSAVLAPPSADDQFERYEKMQQLLRMAATDTAARKVVAEEIFDPHLAPEVRELLLTMCERLVRNADFRDLFLPEYVPGLLLLREVRFANGLKSRPESVLRGYPPERIVATLAALIQPLPADVGPDDRRSLVQRAAVRAMADSDLFRLPFQLENFVLPLIGVLEAMAGRNDTDAGRLVVQALQTITEKRSGIEPADSGARWREWWDTNMKDKPEMERVLLVFRNLRANRAELENELRGLRLAEQLRAVDAARDNYEALIGFVDTGRDPAVLTRALRYVAARLPNAPLPDAQRDRLLPQLRSCYTLLGDQDAVVSEITDAALLIHPQGEELVRTRVGLLRKPETRAAVLLKLARGGQDKESLGVLLHVLDDWRDPEVRVDLRVVKAALSGAAEWKQFDDASAAQVVEALVLVVQSLAKSADGGELAVDVHNAINSLAPRIDTTPIVREVLKADRSVFSLKLQLVTARVALGGKAAPALSKWLRENERKEHLFRSMLAVRDGNRFELMTVLDIMAALGDPFLDPPDRQLYQYIVALWRDPGAANGEMKQRVAKCLAAFAIAEAAAAPAGPEASAPAFAVFDGLMDLGASNLALDEKLVDKLPEATRNRWPDAVRLLRARLSLRTPQFEVAIVNYGELIKAKKVPEATQLSDLQWALARGASEERQMRLAVLQRLVAALHAEGPENVPAHVWKALTTDARNRLRDADQPAAAMHVLRIAHALSAWEPLRPVMLLEANQNLTDWRAAVAEARGVVSSWQANRWRELAVSIEPGLKEMPEEVRAFATDQTTWRLPAVPEARFAAVPGNDTVAVPGLAQRLQGLAHADPAARLVWNLIVEAAAAAGKAVGNNTMPAAAADYETVRQALLNELRTTHGYK